MGQVASLSQNGYGLRDLPLTAPSRWMALTMYIFIKFAGPGPGGPGNPVKGGVQDTGLPRALPTSPQCGALLPPEGYLMVRYRAAWTQTEPSGIPGREGAPHGGLVGSIPWENPIKLFLRFDYRCSVLADPYIWFLSGSTFWPSLPGRTRFPDLVSGASPGQASRTQSSPKDP